MASRLGGYDANGNMISRNGAMIGWASYNYPTSLSAGSESATFAYDPNRRYCRQVYTGPSGTAIATRESVPTIRAA